MNCKTRTGPKEVVSQFLICFKILQFYFKNIFLWKMVFPDRFIRALVTFSLLFFSLPVDSSAMYRYLTETGNWALVSVCNRENLDIPLSDRQKWNLKLEEVCSEIMNSSSRVHCRAPNPASASASDSKWAEANSDLNAACQASMSLNLSL